MCPKIRIKFAIYHLTNIVKKVPAGTVYKVEKIQYSTSGYPRFKVAGGFISANKSIVAVYKESSNTEKANKVVALAKTKIGDPYTQSASGRLGPNSFDCSGFVYYVYKTALGIVLPGTTTTTEESAGKEVSLNTLKPGDLLFYGTRGNTYHVGIYEGNGIMVHAATPEEGVKETAIKYYEPSFARRILN
ncbi:NlpC/P60 family protein [Lactiplantibacillus plantarum]|nr:NlpC/P60 family protein [Lactiplantibacillus plantarum]